MTQSGFEQKVNVIEQNLDGVVDSGSDDDLFYASYLQGHFSVVASQLLQNNEPALNDLHAQMQTSLDKAFANNELEEHDQEQVIALWQRLFGLIG